MRGFLLLLCLLASPGAAAACSCFDGDNAIERADLIFDGVMIESDYAFPCTSRQPAAASPCQSKSRTTTFEVLEIFKGAPPGTGVGETITMTHMTDSGACGVRFTEGSQVVFAKVSRDTGVTTDFCLQALANAPGSREVLRAYRARRKPEAELPR